METYLYQITLDIYVRHCIGLTNVKLLYSSLSNVTDLLLLRVITLFGRVFQKMLPLPLCVWEAIWVVKGERARRSLSRNSEVTCSLGDAAGRMKGGGGAGREWNATQQDKAMEESRGWKPNWFYKGAEVCSQYTLQYPRAQCLLLSFPHRR